MGGARTRALRLRSQRLTGPAAASVEEVAARLVGVQAQDLAFARLAFRPRTAGVTAADVDAALRGRALVWTWTMRGTLHLVAAQDAGWLVGLLGPIFAAKGRPRRLALGLDDELCERALAVLRDVLAADGPQTRAALTARLPIDRDGQAPAHLVMYAALRGVICRAPRFAGEREPTYVLLEDWLGGPPAQVEEDDALARLARRYLAGHGPATARDLASWSGIGLRRARRGFEQIASELHTEGEAGAMLRSAGGGDELRDPGDAAAMPRSEGGGDDLRVDADDRPLPAGAAPAHERTSACPQVALLGHFDPYLLGYATRDLVLDPRHAKRIQAGGGFIAPAALLDGRVVGTWRRGRDDWLEPFEPLSGGVLAALERERGDVERFLAEPSGRGSPSRSDTGRNPAS